MGFKIWSNEIQTIRTEIMIKIQDWPISPLLFNIVLEVLAKTIREKKRNKRNPDQKRSKALFADDMIVYTENPKDSIRKLLELISEFSKVAGYKSIYRNHLYFYTLAMKNQKEKLRNQSHSPLQQKE